MAPLVVASLLGVAELLDAQVVPSIRAGLGVRDPGQVLADVTVASGREHTDKIVQPPAQRLPRVRQGGRPLDKQRIQVLTLLVADVENPRVVVGAGRLDVHVIVRLVHDAAALGAPFALVRRDEPVRHGDAQIARERAPDHHVRPVDLVANAHDLHGRVSPRGERDPRNRVGEVEHPRVGAELFHVAQDGQDEVDASQGVAEPARSAVLGKVLDAVLERNLVVAFPTVLAVLGHRHDHEVGARERALAAGGRPDRHLRAPRVVHLIGELLHKGHAVRVDIHEREFAAVKLFARDQVRQGVQAERGAARPDHHDLKRFHSGYSPHEQRCRTRVTGACGSRQVKSVVGSVAPVLFKKRQLSRS